MELRGASVVASTNRTDWKIAVALGQDEHPTDLEFANGLWMLVGSRQSTNIFVLTSADGTSWETATLPPSDGVPQYPQIRFSPNEWVTLSSRILQSQDGRNWTSLPVGVSQIAAQLNTFPNNSISIVDIVYGAGKWIAAVNVDLDSNGYGALAVSTNLTDWQWWHGRTLPMNTMFYSLKYDHGIFFGAVGAYWVTCTAETYVVTSSDGSNWIGRYNAGAGRELSGPIAVLDGRLATISATGSLCNAITTNPPPQLVFKIESDPLVSLRQNGQGDLIVHRVGGVPVVLEASDDLRQWTKLTELPSGATVEPFTDPAGSKLSARFYRARNP